MFDADFKRRAFENMLENPVPLRHRARLAAYALLDPLYMVISHLPGPIGYAIRKTVYSMLFKSVGKNCIFDVGLIIVGAKNISVGEFTWIDSYTRITAIFGPITIGKRIHISPFCVMLSGQEGIILHDYVGISTGCHIYGHTEKPKDGKRMSGPMIPWRYKAFASGQVIMEKDSFLGAYSIVFPGVTIGEGAVIGASSIVTKNIPPWSIAVGAPATVVGKRDKVTVPDI